MNNAGLSITASNVSPPCGILSNLSETDGTMKESGETKANVIRSRAKKKSGSGFFRFVLLVALLCGIGYGAYHFYEKSSGAMARLTETVLSRVDAVKTNEVKLYFADPQWTRLVEEKSALPSDMDRPRKIAKLIELLARGPAGQAGAVLPRGAKLKQVYMGQNGLAVIDFEPMGEEIRSHGTAYELLSVFAVVHTIVENTEGVNSVRILVGGKEQETFAGRVTISEPLAPRPDLVVNR